MMAPPSTIIITMAGNGERFRAEGYRVAKFRIEVKGRSLFHWAVESLRNFWLHDTQVVFACRREHNPVSFVERECQQVSRLRFHSQPAIFPQPLFLKRRAHFLVHGL